MQKEIKEAKKRIINWACEEYGTYPMKGIQPSLDQILTDFAKEIRRKEKINTFYREWLR